MIAGLQDLCDVLPYNLIGLEVGSFAGESARVFAESGKFLELHCVDPWKSKDPKWAEELRSSEARFDALLAEYPNLIFKHKGFLNNVRDRIPKVNFVYVDAAHGYRDVVKDVYQAMLFAGEGAIYSGHDYTDRWDGVKKAVSFCFPRRKVQTFQDGSWMVAP